jgi:hypothetical protein
MAVMSIHCVVHNSACGSFTKAATAVIALTASTTRRMVPRLRKSGNSRRMGCCLIIGCITTPACNHRAGTSGEGRPRRAPAALVGLCGPSCGWSYCRHPPAARQAEPEPRRPSDRGLRFPCHLRGRLPPPRGRFIAARVFRSFAAHLPPISIYDRTTWPTRKCRARAQPDRCPPPRMPKAGPAASPSPSRRSSSAIPRRLISTGASLPRTSTGRARTPACWRPSAC